MPAPGHLLTPQRFTIFPSLRSRDLFAPGNFPSSLLRVRTASEAWQGPDSNLPKFLYLVLKQGWSCFWCLFCFEIFTPEVGGGEKGGNANFKTKHTEHWALWRNGIPTLYTFRLALSHPFMVQKSQKKKPFILCALNCQRRRIRRVAIDHSSSHLIHFLPFYPLWLTAFCRGWGKLAN